MEINAHTFFCEFCEWRSEVLYSSQLHFFPPDKTLSPSGPWSLEHSALLFLSKQISPCAACWHRYTGLKHFNYFSMKWFSYKYVPRNEEHDPLSNLIKDQ